jgi:hypothetical protein
MYQGPAMTARRFRHDALFYIDVEDFVAQLEPQVRASLEAEEAVMAILPPGRRWALREALGPAGRLVRWLDMEGAGRNPARIIPFLGRFIASNREDRVHRRGVPVLVVAEPVYSARTGAELVEAQQHESLLDLAFGDVPEFTKICPYNLTSLPTSVIEEARRSHPYLRSNGADQRNPDYDGPEPVERWSSAPLPQPPAGQRRLIFGRGIPSSVVEFVTSQCARLGLSAAKSEDMCLAVIAAARGFCPEGGTLRMWSERNTVIAEVEGSERTEKPLAGREISAPRAYPERGLWFANQLCDLLQLRTTAAGSAVRMHLSTV